MSERIWDTYLAREDKESLGPRPDVVWGFGERPALVLVDLYRWVFGDRRPASLREALPEWPGSCGPRAWDAIPHLQRLLREARAARIPIVHLTGLDPAESHIARWDAGLAMSTLNGAAAGALDVAQLDRLRRRFDIIDEVAPLPGEPVIRKAAPSGFNGTLLLPHLYDNRVDAIILCGESTSGCVRATCVDGRAARFKMTVVEECVFDRHITPHAINLFDMHQKYADVLPLDQVVAHLQTLQRTRERA
jgi:nicotinamidase-related amidase